MGDEDTGTAMPGHNRAAGSSRRWVVVGLSVVGLLLSAAGAAITYTMLSSGAGLVANLDLSRGPSPAEATASAEQRAAEAAAMLNDSTVVRAEEFAYLASREGNVKVLEVTGEHRYQPPGVRLVVRAEAYVDTEAYAEVCAEMTFESVPQVWPRDDEFSVVRVDCPDSSPRQVFPPARPLAGVDDQLAELLPEPDAGSAVDEQEVRAAAAELDLDPLVDVDVDVDRDGTAVGVGLRYGYTHACVQARVAPGSVDVWQLGPEELKFAPVCDASSGLTGRSGITS